MRLRDYQREALLHIGEKLHHHPSTLAVLATGLGKTVIFAHAIAREPGRVVVVAHREELITQAAEKIRAATGEDPAIEMAESLSDEGSPTPPRVVVGSVQTMSRPNRLARFDPSQFSLGVIDEAHHSVARTYRAVIEHFNKNPGFRWLGVTATPKRLDDLAMGQVWASVACDYDIAWGVEEGWLVPVRQQIVTVDGLDFSKVKQASGDFQPGELEEVITQEWVLHAMTAPVVELSADRPTLVFCVGVKHAQAVCAVLNRYKDRSAEWVSGETDKDRRREIVSLYRDGRVQYLCNCGVFLEGFDAPPTAVVVMGRPTKSLLLYTQVLGRGTRPLPGTVDGLPDAGTRREAISTSLKPYVTVLDFVGNAERHADGLTVTAADVLGGKFGEPVREYARKTIEEEESPAPVEEALERASAELALLAEEDGRRRRVKARAQYRIQEVQGAGFGPHREQGPRQVPEANRVTARQVWKLVSLGVARATAEGFTKRQASAVIDKLLARQAAS